MTKKWIIVPLVITVFMISISIISLLVTCYAEQETESILTSNMDSLLGHVKDRAGVLFHVNTSSFAVANSLKSRKISSFSDLEKKVAPSLFITLLTTQLATQVSYIRKDGLVFSYERENSQINVIFSNTSSPCSFYRQPIDQETGARNGNIIALKCNETKQRYLDAFNGDTRYEIANGETLFFTFPVGNFGVVTIGVNLKDYLKYVAEIGFVQGRLFLAINGSGLNQTLMPLDQNGGILNDVGSSYEHLSSMYKLRSTHIDVGGISMVFTVAFPYKKTMTIFQAIKITLLSFFSLTIIFLVTLIFIMLKFFKRSQFQETVLRADLIKQKEAVQQAERKSMNKTMAFAQASHDVKNKLFNIIDLIDICNAEVASESYLAGRLNTMKSCAGDLLGILKSILDTSKMESGKMHLEVAEFDISRIIEQSIDFLSITSHTKGLEIIWDPCDFSVLKLGKVQGDETRFKQILDNLLGNAVNYTDEGRVVLRAWANPNLKFASISSDYGFSFSRVFCCLSRRLLRNWRNEINQQRINSAQNDFSVELIFEVDDTGRGIPVEKRAAVFENYVQVKEGSLFINKDNVDKPQGTGLGLGIVQSLVRLMGGEISIQDEEPGKKGTCFRFNVFLRSSGFNDVKDERSELTNKFSVFNEPNYTVKGVHSLLFVRGHESKNILTRWMESLGIKVWIAREIEQISPTLEKIKHSINSSSKSDSILFCKTFSRNSSSQEREGFLSVGRERVVDLAQRKTFYGGLLPMRILIIVDMSKGNPSEIWSSLRDFIENNPNILCKVAYIFDSNTSSQTKDKFKNLCDLTITKPVHGSRLHSLFELVEELERMEEGELKKEINKPLDENKDGKQSSNQNEIVPEIKIKIENDKPLSGMRILYTEDDQIARSIGIKKLVNLGAKVDCAENGLKALNKVKDALGKGIIGGSEEGSCSFTYNIILMDCQMPLMDGYEATQKIREEENRHGIHMPIIALTANTGQDEERKSIQAGMDFHMPKPLEPNRLLEAINVVLGNKT